MTLATRRWLGWIRWIFFPVFLFAWPFLWIGMWIGDDYDARTTARYAWRVIRWIFEPGNTLAPHPRDP